MSVCSPPHLNVQYFQFLVLNDVPVMRYKESIRDIKWSEPIELWNIDDEGRPIFPTWKPSFLRPKYNDVYLKELKEGIKSYIKCGKRLLAMRIHQLLQRNGIKK